MISIQSRARPRLGPSSALPGLSVLAVAAVGLLLMLPTGTAAAPGTPGGTTTRIAVTSTPLHLQHLVVIVLENEVIGNVWAHGPYEKYLGKLYGNATSYDASCHPSAPNYLAIISADTLQCGSDAYHRYSMSTLGDLLTAARYSWAAYAENLPTNACSQPGLSTHGEFAVRHVPFLYFANVTKSSTFCHHHVLPSSSFNSSVAAGTLGNFSFYTPNLCDDGHTGCGGNRTGAQLTRQADLWLKDFLGPMLNHTGRYATTAERNLIAHTGFFVVWDEGLGSNLGYSVAGVTSGNTYAYCASVGAKGDAVCGGHVYAVMVSPYSTHRSFTLKDSNFGLVATLEWLFHVGHLNNPGQLDSKSGFPVMRSLFSFTSN